MTSIKTKAFAKVAAVATGLAMATSMLSLAPMAHAASACSFTMDLTVGSTGTQVTCLQTELIAAGYSIPAGATGYFGSQTKAAVSAWQSANNVSPTYGYFGPISQAKWLTTMGSGGTVSTVPGCTAGALFSSTTGASCTTSTSTVPGCVAGALFSSTTGVACTGGTTTPPPPPTPASGAEGSFTISQAAQPANNTNVTTNTDTKVYGIKVKASGSEITVDRVDLEFGVTVNSSLVNPSQFITSISAWDGSTRLVTMPIASADVVKDANNLYYVRVTGIGFRVEKGVEKELTFTINTNSVGTSDYTRAVTVKGSTVGTQEIRGIDGKGLSSYADATWTSSFTFTASNNSVLTATANSATPKAQTIAVNTTDGVQGVVMQKIDLKSTVGDSTLTDLRVYVKTDSVATSDPTSLLLYDGYVSPSNKGTLLGSAAVTVTSGSATVNFTNMAVAIAKDVTKTLTVLADFPSTGAGVASTTIDDSATQTNTTMFETSDGTSKEVTVSSDITGNDVHIFAADAPIWTMVSSKIDVTDGVVSVSSSTLTGTIVLNVKADGGTMVKPVAGNFAVWFASSTPSTRTTNGGTGYSAANAITVSSPSITVTPNDATVGDGSSYTVTIVGNLSSSNTLFKPAVGAGFNEFMAIESITSDMTPNGGDITAQTWGVDTFYTPSALLNKGTL